MSIDKLTQTIKELPKDASSRWSEAGIICISRCEPDPIIFRGNTSLLQADQSTLWFRWFMEGLAAPESFAHDTHKTRFHVFETVFNGIDSLFSYEDKIRKQALASEISDHIYEEVELIRKNIKRDHATKEQKRELIKKHSKPHCYLCGYEFTKEAIDAFLGVKGRNPIQLPLTLDIFRPRGLVERDIKIEIEHVIPVAKGGHGFENLELACGWCNKYKGAKHSIYDAPSTTSKVNYSIGDYSLHELPEPFWSIRMLGVAPRCQHPSGCTATTLTNEIFISLRDWNGSPNPTNLRFYCKQHDEIGPYRFMPREKIEKIWKGRK
ncbi:HNH endonuclease [Metapseudomonas otitidis]|uniref:HNH endonuclease n=1 Tax=Metapseudomonas otitidis TaxID=319939 RepID=UPI00280A96C3|nr:HNH endonuclease [Pseudomonas otitidis]